MGESPQCKTRVHVAARKHDLRWALDRLFYSGMAAVFLLVMFVGFAPSYYLRNIIAAARPLQDLTPLIHLHAVLFSLWVVVFALQAGLIAVRRPAWHRRLGYSGFCLGLMLLVVGTLTGLQGVERQSGPPGIPPLQWLAIPLVDMLFLALLLAGAFIWRRNPPWHKRLMLVAMIGLMAPALFRMQLPEALQVPVFMASDFLVLLLLAWDLRREGKPHPATLLGMLMLSSWRLLPGMVWETSTWLEFAGWAVHQV